MLSVASHRFFADRERDPSLRLRVTSRGDIEGGHPRDAILPERPQEDEHPGKFFEEKLV
jgi:hypothetical protein